MKALWRGEVIAEPEEHKREDDRQERRNGATCRHTNSKFGSQIAPRETELTALPRPTLWDWPFRLDYKVAGRRRM